MDNQQSKHITDAIKLLRGHTSATLLADSVPYDALYIVEPHTGSLVLTIEESMLEADDVILVIPRDSFDAPIRVNLDLSIDIDEESCDRFTAYHLHQPMPVWARGHISFAKLASGSVIDGGELEKPNPFVDELSKLCRMLNADRGALGKLCRLMTKADIEDAVAVGVDPFGFDVRGRFGMLRIEFPSPVHGGDECQEVLGALLGGTTA